MCAVLNVFNRSFRCETGWRCYRAWYNKIIEIHRLVLLVYAMIDGLSQLLSYATWTGGNLERRDLLGGAAISLVNPLTGE